MIGYWCSYFQWSGVSIRVLPVASAHDPSRNHDLAINPNAFFHSGSTGSFPGFLWQLLSFLSLSNSFNISSLGPCTIRSGLHLNRQVHRQKNDCSRSGLPWTTENCMPSCNRMLWDVIWVGLTDFSVPMAKLKPLLSFPDLKSVWNNL